MLKYTIGLLFTPDFEKVLLINKARPEWQKGKLNFPGGTCAEDERPETNVIRKFAQEVGLKIDRSHWHRIGVIVNAENYTCDIFAAMYIEGIHGQPTLPTNPAGVDVEVPEWYSVTDLPKNVISNLSWLVPFGINYFKGGNPDRLGFGRFTYSNE